MKDTVDSSTAAGGSIGVLCPIRQKENMLKQGADGADVVWFLWRV